MTPSRRDFLKGSGAGAAAWATLGVLPGQFLVERVEAAELTPEKRRELASIALDTAKKLGATYADIRINRYRSQVVTMQSQTDPSTGKLTERGLLLTRFWYIRTVNPQTVQLTGLTRDGVWLIEKGKVVAPVNNFRFNDGPVSLLKNVEAMSTAVSTGDMVLPAIRARDFNFTSKSDAV